MQLSPLVDKQSLENLPELPRMMGETDVALIKSILQKLPQIPRLIEFGPWLGGVSSLLAKYGELHVVDRFSWTAQNAASHPGVLSEGDNFRSLFKAGLSERGLTAESHETLYEDFLWVGETLDFCLIDAPRDGAGLLHCLQSISDSLSAEAYILVKHGLNPAQLEMMCLVDHLIRQGILSLVKTDQPKWCNIAVLRPGVEFDGLQTIELTDDIFTRIDLKTPNADPWGGPLFQMARLSYLCLVEDWPAAFSALSTLPQDTAHLAAWDAVEASLNIRQEAQPQLAIFSDLLCFQNAERSPQLAKPPETSLIWAIRSYWLHQSQHKWSAQSLELQIFEECFAKGYVQSSARLGKNITNANILEFGANLGLSGLSHLIFGAQSYLGVETLTISRNANAMSQAATVMRFVTPKDMPKHIAEIDIAILREMTPGEDKCQAALDWLLPRLPPTTDVIAIDKTGIHVIRSKNAADWKERS